MTCRVLWELDVDSLQDPNADALNTLASAVGGFFTGRYSQQFHFRLQQLFISPRFLTWKTNRHFPFFCIQVFIHISQNIPHLYSTGILLEFCVQLKYFRPGPMLLWTVTQFFINTLYRWLKFLGYCESWRQSFSFLGHVGKYPPPPVERKYQSKSFAKRNI